MCTESENLTAYLDDELAPEARARFEAHLPACAACQGDLALLRSALPPVEALPPLEPSPGLRRQVLGALPAPRSPLWARLADWAAPLGGLAAAAAVAGLVLVGGRRPPAETELPESLALAQNLELLEELDAVQSADLSDEDLEVVAHLDQLERSED